MIYLNMPVGSNFGWGVCGKYVARELARIAPMHLLTHAFSADSVGDELECAALLSLVPPPSFNERFNTPDPAPLEGPLLQTIRGADLMPMEPRIKGRPTIGYSFFEDNIISQAALENARRHFKHIITGCSWCTKTLADAGLANVWTVLQGIDPSLFHQIPYQRTFFPDRFVVFSGGKLELRKGQDIVIRAYKVLQDRHKDVMLVTNWFNMWGESLDTIRYSRLIRFAPRSTQYHQAMGEVLSDNGIDVGRTVILSPRVNSALANIYRNTDVGIFPNRAEGGTNLVLMEYMACGRPVIASNCTGHADVVTTGNARVIESPTSFTILNANQVPMAQWPEPNLEQAIEHLEWAYQNRDKLQGLANQAAADMQRFTWAQTARAFLETIQSIGT